jgi:hypothetical protein
MSLYRFHCDSRMTEFGDADMCAVPYMSMVDDEVYYMRMGSRYIHVGEFVGRRLYYNMFGEIPRLVFTNGDIACSDTVYRRS